MRRGGGEPCGPSPGTWDFSAKAASWRSAATLRQELLLQFPVSAAGIVSDSLKRPPIRWDSAGRQRSLEAGTKAPCAFVLRAKGPNAWGENSDFLLPLLLLFSSPSSSSPRPPLRVAPRSRDGEILWVPQQLPPACLSFPHTGPALPCPVLWILGPVLAPNTLTWQVLNPNRPERFPEHTECEMLRLLPACPKGVLALGAGARGSQGLQAQLRQLRREGGSRKACVGAAPGRCISEQVLSRSAGRWKGRY